MKRRLLCLLGLMFLSVFIFQTPVLAQGLGFKHTVTTRYIKRAGDLTGPQRELAPPHTQTFSEISDWESADRRFPGYCLQERVWGSYVGAGNYTTRSVILYYTGNARQVTRTCVDENGQLLKNQVSNYSLEADEHMTLDLRHEKLPNYIYSFGEMTGREALKQLPEVLKVTYHYLRSDKLIKVKFPSQVEFMIDKSGHVVTAERTLPIDNFSPFRLQVTFNNKRDFHLLTSPPNLQLVSHLDGVSSHSQLNLSFEDVALLGTSGVGKSLIYQEVLAPRETRFSKLKGSYQGIHDPLAKLSGTLDLHFEVIE